MKIKLKLRNRIKVVLADLGRTPEDLADALGMDIDRLKLIINGTKDPGITVALTIANTLKYPVNLLFWIEEAGDDEQHQV